MRIFMAAIALSFLASIAISLSASGVGSCQSDLSSSHNATPTPTFVPGLSSTPQALSTSGLPDWWYKLPDELERPFPAVEAGTHHLTVPNRKCAFLIHYALRVAHQPMRTSNAACASQMSKAFWYQANDPMPTPPVSTP